MVEQRQTTARRFWNSRTASMIPYVPGEQPRDRVFVKLNTNENPYAPAPEVAAVFTPSLAEQLRLYPDPNSLELRRAIAGYYGLLPEQIFVGNGSDEVLAFAFQAFFEPDGCFDPSCAVVFPDITYSFYPVYARSGHLNWRTVSLNDDFTVPLDLLGKPSAGIVLANPNAPTGIAAPASSIAWLADQDRDRLIIVDEAYVDFGAESMVSFLGEYDNLLVIQTFSKSRSLAGLRLGFAMGAPELIQGLERVRDSFNSYTVNRLAQAAGKAALTAASWFEETRARIIRSRKRLAQALSERNFEVLPSAANFLFVRHPEKTGEELYLTLKEKGVLVRHFNQPRIHDFLRITVGTDAEIDTLISILDLILV